MKTKIHTINGINAIGQVAKHDVEFDNSRSEIALMASKSAFSQGYQFLSLEDLREICQKIVKIQPLANEILRIIQD